MQNALIVNGSPRKNGNTHWLATLVAQELQKRNVETKIVAGAMLKSLNNGCIGCQGCQRSKDFLCVFKDDVQPLVASMPTYKYVIFTTPVYFFGPSAQMKLIVDRMFSLIKSKSDGSVSHPFKDGSKMGLVLTAGGEADEGADLAIDMFKRIADYVARPFESLLMPLCPMLPMEIDDAATWQQKAVEFCDRLL